MPNEDTSKPQSGVSGPGAGDKDLADRLGALDRRLDAVNERKSAGKSHEPTPQDNSALGQAMRLSGEFTAGVIVGGGFGWACDRWFGTSPWGMIMFVMLGFCAGIYNVMRSAGMLKPARSVPPSKDD
jgi:ATP synthase protein I